MGKDMFRIKVYNCDNKVFDTGLGDFEATLEKSYRYLEKMQPQIDIDIRRAGGRRR